MTVPLSSRSDLKAAGRNMAVEAVDAVAAYFATLSPAEMDDTARTDAMSERLVELAASVGRTYLEGGVPPPWVKCFLAAFHRTATARLADHSLAARPPAGAA